MKHERESRWSRLLPGRLRLRSWPVILAAVLLIPAFVCGLAFLFYLVFPPPQTDILILGVDSREGEGWVARADSIMLAGVDPAHLRVSLLSVPRDLAIDVPNYGLQRINTVNMLGEMDAPGTGPDLMQAAFTASFGITPERYVRLDFDGFVDLVNAVGGVTIDVERTLVDDFYPTPDGGVMRVQFDPGVQHMDGERALIYARTRHADSDYERVARQQQVVSALMGKLVNPLHWPAAWQVLQQSVDTDLTLWDGLTLAPTVVLGGSRADRFVIDREHVTATAEGTLIPDYATVLPWLQERFN